MSDIPRSINDDKIMKMAMVDLYNQFKSKKANSCQIDVNYDNKIITFKIVLMSVVDKYPVEDKDGD